MGRNLVEKHIYGCIHHLIQDLLRISFSLCKRLKNILQKISQLMRMIAIFFFENAHKSSEYVYHYLNKLGAVFCLFVICK